MHTVAGTRPENLRGKANQNWANVLELTMRAFPWAFLDAFDVLSTTESGEGELPCVAPLATDCPRDCRPLVFCFAKVSQRPLIRMSSQRLRSDRLC